MASFLIVCVCVVPNVTPAAGQTPKIERATGKYVHMRGVVAASTPLSCI